MNSKKQMFGRHVIFSYSTKILALLISIFYTLFVANFLGPEKYGIVTYFITFITSLVGILGLNFLISSLTHYFPKIKARKFFKGIVIIQAIIVTISFVVLFAFSGAILELLGKTNQELFQLTTILIILTPFYSLFQALFQGFKRFGKVFKVGIVESSLNLALAIILLHFFQFDVFGVVIAKIISTLTVVLLFIILSKKLEFTKEKIDKRDLKKYALTFIPYSWIRGWDAQALLIIMGLFVGNAMLGLYYIAQKITSIIVSTPISSLREVLLPYSLEKAGEEQVVANYASINIKFSLIVSIILSILLVAIAEFLLSVFFPKYLEASSLIWLFALLYIITSFNILFTIFISLNKVGLLAIASASSLASTLFFGLLLVPRFQIQGIILTEIIANVIWVLVMLALIKKLKVRIELIPTLKDLKYFATLFLRFAKAFFKRA